MSAKVDVSIDDLIKNFSIQCGKVIFLFTRLGVPTPKASNTDKLKISDFEVKVGDLKFKTNSNLSKIKNKKVKLGIRSEFIKIGDNQKENLIPANLDRVEDFGNFKLITAKINGKNVK